MINFVMLGLPLLCGAMASPSLAQKAESVEMVNEIQPKLVNYNDTDKIVTLSANEVNNYHFDNLKSYLLNYDFSTLPACFDIIYENVTYTYDELFVDDTYSYIAFTNTNVISLGDYGSTNTEISSFGFYTEVNQEYVLTPFNDYIELSCQADAYASIKTAIEQDIVDNTASMPSIADLFTPITQAITSFVGALGQAFSSVTALFWTTGDNAGPTFLGLLVLIGVGVGLIYGAYRIIKGLMHRI